ncbi:MAG: SDR family oxidoreductase, partial [Dehalococcoidia bacterium]
GVTCNAISPGAATRMTATIPGRQAAAPPAQAPRAPTGREPEMVAPMAAYLASDDAWNINGYVFAVAGGSVSVLNHPQATRTLWKPGMWTLDELSDLVPRHLMAGISNPAPPPPDLEIPGRPAQAQGDGAAGAQARTT